MPSCEGHPDPRARPVRRTDCPAIDTSYMAASMLEYFGNESAVIAYRLSCAAFVQSSSHPTLGQALGGSVVCSNPCLEPFIAFHKLAAMRVPRHCEAQFRRTEAIARFYERSATSTFMSDPLSRILQLHITLHTPRDNCSSESEFPKLYSDAESCPRSDVVVSNLGHQVRLRL